MIPWRLKLAGVRDFPPQSIDLSGKQDHIGILGPNGVGKSTLSFCMGAVLHSGKVDIGGLRSANLSDEHMWKVTISFLFKNAGKMKVDAPEYVQFELHVQQTSHQTFAKEYRIAQGDTIDEWDEITTFKSGDKTNNFPAYKRLLQIKYHIDPDYYYLIWYQNEVNQFSEMAPEERFRVFSEMHGIDKIQKNWEISRELVQEAQEHLEEAKRQQGNRKFLLSIQKKKLDQFLDNQKRLKNGFIQYYHALTVLIKKTQEEIEVHKESEQFLQDQLDEANEQLRTFETNLMQLQNQLQEKQQERQRLEEQVQELDDQLAKLRNQYQQTKGQFEKLEKELSAIRKEISEMPNEQMVDKMLEESLKEVERIEPIIQTEKERIHSLRNDNEKTKDEVMKLSHESEYDQNYEKTASQLLKMYGSRHQVEEKIDRLDTTITNEKDQLKQIQENHESYKNEQKELLRNEVNSPRQKQGKQFFLRRGIHAYALREFIKLDEQAKLSHEEAFDSLKYTMFVNSRTFDAPNDLYYVALPAIVPKEYLTKLPDYQLSIRTDLSAELEPLAVKALWWIKSFFEENSAVFIKNGCLIDEKGVRGPQEHQKYILSANAVKERLKKLDQLLKESTQQIDQLTLSIQENVKKAKELRDIIGNISEAEAFMANEKHRVLRQKRIDELQSQIKQYNEDQQYYETQLNILENKKSKEQLKFEMYSAFKDKWLEFAKEKDKIVQMQELEEHLNVMDKSIKEYKNQADIRRDQYDICQEKCTKLDREWKNIKISMEDCSRSIKELNRQLGSKEKEKEAEQRAYFEFNQELVDLEKTAPSFIQEEKENCDQPSNWTIYDARQKREEGKTVFENALHEDNIDELAPENYQKMKEEFDLTSEEVNESESLLLQNKDRMEKLRNDLDSTIGGKVLLINKHFVSYMNEFGFEGEIDWDMHEGKKGIMHYYLYLRAKKYGHKMTMEDVSVKARGGRHGIGLSGGEKSLVSLLYALALLQTIQTNPSFIVLDEFDSALDEGRKVKVFDLYVKELGRKMIILTPKSHDTDYMNRFSKAYVIYHRPEIPESGIMKLKIK